jgi:hypothetical protein
VRGRVSSTPRRYVRVVDRKLRLEHGGVSLSVIAQSRSNSGQLSYEVIITVRLTSFVDFLLLTDE